jgi:hypothetical protein
MQTPFFTLIITLTERMSYLFPYTLDSLISQLGAAPFEVIIVDGTKGKVHLHHLPVVNVQIVQTKSTNIFAMVNEVLPLAKGQYIHCMTPGEYYTSKKTLAFMMKIIHGYDFPDLLYTTRVVRHQFGQPSIDAQPLLVNDLKKGAIPTSMLPFWFRKETLLMLGGFNEKYVIQGGYDIICRYFLAPTLRKAFVRRILTDYEYRKQPSKWVIDQHLETFWISLGHFGPTRYLLSWLMQNCLRLFLFLWKIVRGSFWKRHVIYE